MIKKLNRVICGDSYKKLQNFASESVDLCYLDPPFFANRIFETKGYRGKISSFNDKWHGNLDDYLDFMITVLDECHRTLYQILYSLIKDLNSRKKFLHRVSRYELTLLNTKLSAIVSQDAFEEYQENQKSRKELFS